MSEWPETSESLILRVKDPQDAAAWTQFLAIYRPVVYRLARRRGLQHADADDLAQSVFLSISRAVGQWELEDDAPQFRNWLGRIAHNAILNALSRGKPDQATGSSSVQLLLGEVPASDDAMTTALIHESRMEAFRWAAREVESEFTEMTWAMFQETAVEGRPVAEVAEALGRSTGAVYVARCRVMQRIKERVNDVSDILEH